MDKIFHKKPWIEPPSVAGTSVENDNSTDETKSDSSTDESKKLGNCTY